MMLNTFRELNDYSNFLPKKIKENVKKEKYEILGEIRKIVSLKKNNSYNVTLVIKLYNLYETINTTKHKSFHFYMFMIKYLWFSLHNKNISPNLKSYICQSISGILDNIKSHILDDYFFEYDRELICKDGESTPVQAEDVGGTSHDVGGTSHDVGGTSHDVGGTSPDEGDASDVTNNSYEGISDHYYDEYKYLHEDRSDVDSTTINENKPHMSGDRYYLSVNGIFERGEENSSSFFNEEVLINGKDESFRLYIQKCIFNIIDYRYLFSLFYDYLSNNSRKQDEYSHNAYKNFITSVINLLAMLRPFCYYNIDVHNLLFDFSLNNLFSCKYEEYVDMRADCLLGCAQEAAHNAPADGTHDGNFVHRGDHPTFAINLELNRRANNGVVLDDNYKKHKEGAESNGFTGMADESTLQHVDLAAHPIERLEICTRYNTVFLNFVMLSQLGSDDLCFKLIKHEKALLLYRKLKRYNWHSINYAFVRIIYKGLKYAYMYNISLERQMKEIVRLLFFLFLYYIKLPCNVQLSSAKKYIPDDYNLLINDDDSVVKTVSKTFVFLLNRMYRKGRAAGGNTPEEVKQKEVEAKVREKQLLQGFLSLLNDENFNIGTFDEVTVRGEGEEDDGTTQNRRSISSLFHDLDTHEFFNVITCLFMPHIHPSSVGKHLGNINLFINTFLFCFIRKLKRESLYLKRVGIRGRAGSGGNINGGALHGEPPPNLHGQTDDYVANYFISEEDKKFVIEKFTQLAVQGMFPKSNKGVSLFENILKHICVVDMNCLDIFVKKMLECLINVNISTQICNCLLSLCLILPLLIRYKAGHLKDLLSVMSMGIDICDVYKSFTIFSFLSILFSYICIVKIDNVGVGSGADLQIAVREYKKFMHMEGSQVYTLYFLNDEQIEEVMKERKELVDYLCYWVHEFFEKILYFIKFTKNEKSKDTKKLNGEKKETKVGNDIYTGLKTTLISLFIHLDHDIVYELCQKFLNNIEQENAKSLSIIPLAFGLVNNKKVYDTLFNAFYRKLITKRKKKRAVPTVEASDGVPLAQQEEEYFAYSKNEYANDDTVKCYLQFLSNLIRRAKNEYINLEDIYKLIEIYIVEDNNVAFKYICKIMYRFLEINFSLSVKEYSCFKIEENMSPQEKVRTLGGWGIPWYILNNTKKEGEEAPHKTSEETQEVHTTFNAEEEAPSKGECPHGGFPKGRVFNADELVKWKTPSKENVKVGKKFTYFLLDYVLDLMIQCDVPVTTPNLVKYVEKRKLREKKIDWKFPLNHSNVISRIYKIIKCIVKPISCLYPDERYNYNTLLAKCHVVNTKLSFYLYVYMCEMVVTLSLHVLKIPKQILSMAIYARYNPNDDRLEHKSSFSSVNSENSVNDANAKQILVDKNELKKLKEEFFTNIINNREKTIKADAKMQRKIIKCIHFLLLKCNESANTTMYNEYINSVLSFTYNMYPYSYNYDIIKSQYVNNVFSLYNERLKQRKKNYCFKGYREQLCNILFFTNLSVYSQVRSYAQSTMKLVLPTFKIIKIPFLKICSFYLKNYIKLYVLVRSERLKGRHAASGGMSGMSGFTNGTANEVTNGVSNGVTNGVTNGAANEVTNGVTNDDTNGTTNDPTNGSVNDPTNALSSAAPNGPAESGSLSKLSSLKSLGELNNHDYFENKCISCFNGILINITSNSGLIKKISTDVHLLKKYIKIILNILRLEMQKDEITLRCMKLVYAIINSRFIKNREASSVSEEKKKKKTLNGLFLFLKAESAKKNNVYAQIVILAFLICYENFVILNHGEFYFSYLLENLIIKKNVHVYNLAYYGFIKFLKYFNRNVDRGIVPAHVMNVFRCADVYNNFVEVCIYKNLKSKKKSNSINAIIVNLSKIQKSFKGFAHISETHVKDFFYYHEFFKFLVNLQNGYDESEGGEPTPGVVHTVEPHNQVKKQDEGGGEAPPGDVPQLGDEQTNRSEADVRPHFSFFQRVIHNLKELQQDAHADNEYKSTFISLVCPLLFSLRKLKRREAADAILESIISLLEKEIAIVNMDVYAIWMYYFHLLFINIKKKDLDKYEKLFKFCLCFNFQDTSNLIFKKKTQLLSIMLMYSMHKNIHLMDDHLMEFLKLIDNGNITVRQVVGDLLAYLLYVLHDHRYYSHLKCMYLRILIYLYKSACEVIEYLQGQETLSKQSKFIYTLETLAYITITIFSIRSMYVLNNVSIPFLKMFILSFQLVDNFINGIINKAINCFMCPSLYLFEFEKISQTEGVGKTSEGNTCITCAANRSYEIASAELLSSFDSLLQDNMGNLFIKKLSHLLSKNNWKIRNCVLQFCFYFHAYYCIFFYSRKENTFLLNVFISLLVDNYIEIQNLSRDILSSVLCFYDSQTVQSISQYFLSVANEKSTLLPSSPQRENPETSNTSKMIEKKKTVAIYALISVVNSFPNHVPQWLPNILISVARMSNNKVHIIKKEIEKCIQNFLRTHKDEWEYKYKLVFTEDQLNILDMYKGGLNYFT
ncbi:proteasome activator complex subunit 4, putative [Plasmodium vivax]|uniref:Proteasome activator complex subunit 4, putative n=1 Tax=Plasmodium vivax TaxID=5855 RepID=A0A565A3W5_PLAVI|nr:proteasome activator complex subunit 4, putative [Plasmodium vivax]